MTSEAYEDAAESVMSRLTTSRSQQKLTRKSGRSKVEAKSEGRAERLSNGRRRGIEGEQTVDSIRQTGSTKVFYTGKERTRRGRGKRKRRKETRTRTRKNETPEGIDDEEGWQKTRVVQ
jgi:hypothetical protein